MDSLPDLVLTAANLGDSFPTFGEGLISGDFNGDDTADLAVSVRRDPMHEARGSVFFYWGGQSFDTIPDLIVYRPGEWVWGRETFGWLLENIGDFNADGYDDVFASQGVSYDDTLSFVYFGGPSIDTVPDMVIAVKCTDVARVGDVNGDSHSDFMTSYDLPWWFGGRVDLYHGGPSYDSIPDVTIRQEDYNGHSEYFGMYCLGLGDVNGDGVDDYGFSSVLEDNYAGVFVFAGKGNGTAVDTGQAAPVPVAFELFQNYPNPFNGSTSLEYRVDERSRVRLTVYNVLGVRVMCLVDGERAAGSYRVEWDGRDEAGVALPSGVYIYSLKVGEQHLSRKMLLLK
jgi:hypothetical protein